MGDYKQTLRRLAVRDDWFLQHVLPDGPANVTISQLDARTHALVRIGALIVLDAPPPSFEADIEAALRAGATPEAIVGTLVAVMPIAGSARVTAAAPNVALGIGYDLELALELLNGGSEGHAAAGADTT
jgi:alkylhydroperoxidase/carboxymuconolactone decarboxylase family protein YurZ